MRRADCTRAAPRLARSPDLRPVPGAARAQLLLAGPPALRPRHSSLPKMQLRTFIVKSQASGDLVRRPTRCSAHDVLEPGHLAGGRPGYVSKSEPPRDPL